MRIGAIPENLIERLLLALGRVPTPMLDTLHGMLFARTVMVATRLGVFEALSQTPGTASDVAERIGADARAIEKLLHALVGIAYVRFDGSSYSLARVARRWMLQDHPQSLYDNMMYRPLEWRAAEHFEEFVRSGEPLRVHEELTPEMWETYQRGMRSLAGLSAPEIARRMPVPRHAREMIDIGGSHGFYSVALCRRHPHLKATVLDLPEAIAFAAPILARENMAERVIHRAGNALTEDLGESRWDLVFLSQLVHHFDEASNRELIERAARSLRPGGVVAIMEMFRPARPGATGQSGALLDLFFAATSQSGTWSWGEISDWQRSAGLVPRRPIRLLTVPGAGIQAATKPT